VSWTWGRRRDSNTHQGVHPRAIAGAAQAVGRSAITGYEQAPEWERAAFSLSTSIATTIGAARAVTYWRDQRQKLPALKGTGHGRRVHHYLPGIALGFAAGVAATLAGDHPTRRLLAAPLGVGVGMTLDEAALLLEREDLYWNNEQLPLLEAGAALGGASILAARFVRCGESLAEGSPPAAS
jgi:hypothetical protein